MEGRGLGRALPALGASLELAFPVVVLALVGYYGARRYGELAGLAGLLIGFAIGFVIGVRQLVERYGFKGKKEVRK